MVSTRVSGKENGARIVLVLFYLPISRCICFFRRRCVYYPNLVNVKRWGFNGRGNPRCAYSVTSPSSKYRVAESIFEKQVRRVYGERGRRKTRQIKFNPNTDAHDIPWTLLSCTTSNSNSFSVRTFVYLP